MSTKMSQTVGLVLVLLMLPFFCDCQVNIEVYDAELFLRKTNVSLYNPNAFPRFQKPLIVNVSLQLDRWGPYDEAKSEFTASIQVHLKWFDERLSVRDPQENQPNQTIRHFEADQIHLLQIWRPSIFFSNANSLSPDLLSDKSNGQIMGKIGANGRVQIVKRALITANCKVNIKLYPVDVLVCEIEFQSTSFEQQLHLSWDETKPILFSDDYNWGVFDLISFQYLNSRVSYDVVGPFSRLEVSFYLRRKMGYFLIDVYLPSALFVISSWASFWIDIPAAPARVALVLTTMLTHVTSTKSIHEKHPRVAYIHSLDVWVMVCSMFIFAALIEYATANYFYHKRDRIKDKKLEGSMETVAKQDKLVLPNPTIEINNNDIEEVDGASAMNGSTPSLYKRHQSLPAERTRKTSEYLSPEYSTQNGIREEPTLLRRAWRSMLSLVVPPYEHDIETRRTALEIDRKSRIIFPFAFLLFNIVYWTILIVFSFAHVPNNTT